MAAAVAVPATAKGGDDRGDEWESEELCAVCLDRAADTKLQPCGHSLFCRTCVRELYRCPLCRAPVLRPGSASPHDNRRQAEDDDSVADSPSHSVISESEAGCIQVVFLFVWMFIFVFGIVENTHDVRRNCEGGDPVNGPLSVNDTSWACAYCSYSRSSIRGCFICEEGYYNLGAQCYKYLENLPALTTGAALGGTVYFVLIVGTQVTGIASELVLICRLLKRQLMPRKELFVLLTALTIEVLRMVMVDFFVMQEYFGGRAYSVFREPVACSPADAGSWLGADGVAYCSDDSLHGPDARYYLASHMGAWTADSSSCSTFTTQSALLGYDEHGVESMPGPGHVRFKTMGWIVGGEFALYYFFATFINEVADNMFVVPTTTRYGWFCKVFSVALEVFQLGALCPAAVFTHQDCLFFTDPLGVSLHTMSFIVLLFGYMVWGFVFLSLPLAVAGLLMLQAVVLTWSATGLLKRLFRSLAPHCGCCEARPKTMAESMERAEPALERALARLRRSLGSGFDGAKNATMLLAFIPMLLGGMFLGTLVVVGQASKEGTMQQLTAIVLLSDVLFKILATVVTEAADFLLHRRVVRAVSSGANRRLRSMLVGRPALPQEPAAEGGEPDDPQQARAEPAEAEAAGDEEPARQISPACV